MASSIELNGDDQLIGEAGQDHLDGLAGNDTLIGGAGEDIVNGGAGNDRIEMLVSARDVDQADGGRGTDTLALVGTVPGSGIVTVNLGGSDQVTDIGGTPEGLLQNNFENLDASGLGGTVHVTGSAGANRLIGSGGNDHIVGGAGNDTFRFALGNGQDLVQDSSGRDSVLFQSGINPLDLIISQEANDLRIAIEGTTDQITVQNWYTSTANQTETIQTGNREVLLSTQVETLIQAMAQFTFDTGLSWDAAAGGAGDPTEQAQFQNIIAANWQ